MQFQSLSLKTDLKGLSYRSVILNQGHGKIVSSFKSISRRILSTLSRGFWCKIVTEEAVMKNVGNPKRLSWSAGTPLFHAPRMGFIALCLLFSCKTNTPQPSPQPPGTPSPTPAAVGQIVLDSCLGLSGVNERCTLVTNASACTQNRCRNLVVIFSGGEMGCIAGSGYQNALTGFASNGYAAVCINYFDTPIGSGDVPYVDEATRLDTAVREATTGAGQEPTGPGNIFYSKGSAMEPRPR